MSRSYFFCEQAWHTALCVDMCNRPQVQVSLLLLITFEISASSTTNTFFSSNKVADILLPPLFMRTSFTHGIQCKIRADNPRHESSSTEEFSWVSCLAMQPILSLQSNCYACPVIAILTHQDMSKFTYAHTHFCSYSKICHNDKTQNPCRILQQGFSNNSDSIQFFSFSLCKLASYWSAVIIAAMLS